MIVLAVVALGLGVSFLLPVNPLPSADRDVSPGATATGALDPAV